MILTPSHWHKYEDKSVLVFDDIFENKELTEALSIMMMSLPYERRPSFDNELSTGVEKDFYFSLPELPEVIEGLIEHYYPKMCKAQSEQLYSHSYAASLRYGDFTRIHQDIDCDDCITFLYYGNVYWDVHWGGETFFYDGDQTSAIYAMTPRPGRLVMFNASLYHRTGVPARDCSSHRYGLSVFYRCKNQHPSSDQNQSDQNNTEGVDINKPGERQG